MPTSRAQPKSIDEYIASFSPEVQAILERIRLTIRKAAPDAQETISYNIPTFRLNGALVHFAASKKHIGFYPPVRGDTRLEKAISTYVAEKGNLALAHLNSKPRMLMDSAEGRILRPRC